jgi:hypothetical protein
LRLRGGISFIGFGSSTFEPVQGLTFEFAVNLVPIVDSYMMLFMVGKDTRSLEKPMQVALVLDTIDAVRKNLRANASSLDRLSENLSSLRFPFSKTRMHDILAWTIWKWNVLGKAWGAEEKGNQPVTTLGCWRA